jgi:hypothetical protein
MEIEQENKLEKEYLEHSVFQQLKELIKFYDALSYTTMGFISQGTEAILNLDTYVFSSMSGTLESIHNVLFMGRINDAYALLRKYYDSTIINVYTSLYLNDHFSIENFIVEQIDNWRSGEKALPKFGEISQYIKNSKKIKPITDILQSDGEYQGIRDRCNNNMHYNFYRYLLFNDNQIYLKNRVGMLNRFQSDLIAIYVEHLAYLFYLNDHYMMSSDYVDCLDVGMIPEQDSQYWVATFIQEAFDKYIKPNRPDVANEIKTKTSMKLD